MAYAYSNLGFAFYNIGQQDSTYFYIKKSESLVHYVYDSDKAAFLTNIGLLYKMTNPKKPKNSFAKL